MQASLEAEARGKAEAMRMKKKIESDINELEVALDGANRGRAEAEKSIKKIQQQIHEVLSSIHTHDQRSNSNRFYMISLDRKQVNKKLLACGRLRW